MHTWAGRCNLCSILPTFMKLPQVMLTTAVPGAYTLLSDKADARPTAQQALTSCGNGDSVNMAVAHKPGSCAIAALSFSGDDCCWSHNAAAAAPTREGASVADPGATADHSTCIPTSGGQLKHQMQPDLARHWPMVDVAGIRGNAWSNARHIPCCRLLLTAKLCQVSWWSTLLHASNQSAASSDPLLTHLWCCGNTRCSHQGFKRQPLPLIHPRC